MPEHQKYINICIRCPLCNKKCEIFVDREEVENDPSGIVRVPIEHDSPEPHILVVDIDSSGFPRGIYIIRGYGGLERIPVADVIRSIGLENFARLLCWLLIYDNVCLYGYDEDTARLLRMLLSCIFSGAKRFVSEDKAEKKINIFNVPMLEFNIDLIVRRIKTAISSIRDHKSLAAYIRHEVQKYADFLEVLEKIMKQSARKLTMEDLIKMTDNELGKEEIKILLAILRARGISVEDKVIVPEFRITEVF